MGYEYEESNKQIVFTVDNESSMNQLNERIKELEEVYRKAKAWDNYLLSVEDDAKNEFGNNEALIKHAAELNKKIFMEDE